MPDHPRRCGENDFLRRSDSRGTDHPRRCGENFYVNLPERVADGSPPQVRGKQLDIVDRNKRLRITPAGAGKTVPCVVELK